MSEATEQTLNEVEQRFLALINSDFNKRQIFDKKFEFLALTKKVEAENDFGNHHVDFENLLDRMRTRFEAKRSDLLNEPEKEDYSYISEQQNRANAVLINYSRFLESKNCRGLDLDKVNEFIKTI